MPELPHAPRIIQGILFDLGSTLWRRVDDDRWRALEIEANARAGTLLPPDTRRGATRELSDEALGAMIRREIDLRIRGVLRQAPDWEPDFALICQQALWALAITPVERLLSLAVFEALRIRAAQSRVLFDDTLSTL